MSKHLPSLAITSISRLLPHPMETTSPWLTIAVDHNHQFHPRHAHLNYYGVWSQWHGDEQHTATDDKTQHCPCFIHLTIFWGLIMSSACASTGDYNHTKGKHRPCLHGAYRERQREQKSRQIKTDTWKARKENWEYTGIRHQRRRLKESTQTFDTLKCLPTLHLSLTPINWNV